MHELIVVGGIGNFRVLASTLLHGGTSVSELGRAFGL